MGIGRNDKRAVNAHASSHTTNASINREKQGIGLLIKAEDPDFEKWKFPKRDSTGRIQFPSRLTDRSRKL